MRVAGCLALTLGATGSFAPLRAQSAGPPSSPLAAPLAEAWAALESGRYLEAARMAEAALASSPHDHGAVVLKLRALTASGDAAGALEAYAAWTQGRPQPDPHLLGVVADGVLRDLAARAPLKAQQARALAVLAETGDRLAARRLTELDAASGLAGLTGADRERAETALIDAVGSATGSRKVAAIRALAEAKADRGADAIRLVLSDPDPMVRSAAAEALGRLETRAQGDALIPLLSDPMPDVRYSAALALARLGRSEGDQMVGAMLASGVPDMVLAVAEALPDRQERWHSAVEAILSTESAVDRLRAARAVAPVSPDAAQAVVTASLADPNVAVREEAARSLSVLEGAGAPVDWHRLLTDASPWVRLEAAARLLADVTGRRLQREG